ncbi:hypothetical protein MYSTI_05872 [Myxococcus stipitatus DSM 14675]|uniref:Lipoprotein n=1 Tax=Myxococcus stipitatus (strain DSM 14675 / JCM 12634 / Mx s8) TaxID=1278073 RepID=L7UGI2_MYXSD|nr:hypothetical protein [Myxococcus stipitatus]AGC47148.1 hypothetical protein MYSTI_05872 [Myxococcus stipitatus DSM 14675]
MTRLTLPGLLFATLTACATAPREPPTSEATPHAAACPTQKFAFEQETGCRNDGSVEFCLPTGDDALVARVKAIAPTVQVAGVSRGRAGCNVPEETLYFFPTSETECHARHGALTPAAWDTLCRLAELPEVRQLVPTWYE